MGVEGGEGVKCGSGGWEWRVGVEGVKGVKGVEGVEEVKGGSEGWE